jgi:CheY-like chemotaxis protein
VPGDQEGRRLRDIPVILLTSLTSLHDVIKGLDCGADNFIRKPFEATTCWAASASSWPTARMRGNERVQLGMQVNLGGQTHFITAERQQIFDLLISTYEEAIHMTEQLQGPAGTHRPFNYQSLEGLYRVAEALNPVLSEQDVGELRARPRARPAGRAGACDQAVRRRRQAGCSPRASSRPAATP